MNRSPNRLAIGVTLGALLATPVFAFTWDSNMMQGVQHFAACWDHMLNNPGAHRRICAPGIPPVEIDIVGTGTAPPSSSPSYSGSSSPSGGS